MHRTKAWLALLHTHINPPEKIFSLLSTAVNEESNAQRRKLIDSCREEGRLLSGGLICLCEYNLMSLTMSVVSVSACPLSKSVSGPAKKSGLVY